MKTFDVAVVGCGGVSRMHLDGYRARPERVRVVAACDPDADRAKRTGREYGISSVFASLDDMIARAGWQVAVVCTPTRVRAPVIETLARAGKHVFVEKPLADSWDEACSIVTACERAGVLLAIGQNFRYHYPFDIARGILQDGRLGQVIAVLHQDLMFRQDRGWRVEQVRHALSVMGVHWFDGFRWMLDRDARSLVCTMHSSPAIDCRGETDASLQIAFENGATVSYVQSFSSHLARTETLVLGEKGLLALTYEQAALYVGERASEPVERWHNPYSSAGKPESAFRNLDLLLAALEHGDEPSNSGHDNLKTVALLEGAYRSAERQEAVQFKQGRLL